VFARLAAMADVMLEGFRPGVVERLGVDYATVSQINPGIVYCSITGFGQTGPLRDLAGHDVNYLSVAGVLDLIGPADGAPAIPGVQVADIAGGGLQAAIGILLALFERAQSGRGQYIDISMTDGSAALLPLVKFFFDASGQPPRRGDALLSHRYACYNTYETADGRHIAVGALENRFWAKLCRHFDLPQYIALQYDDTHREEIIARLRQIFKGRTLAAWEPELAALDACCTPVRTVTEVLAAPLFRQREMVVDIADDQGRTHQALGLPIKLSRSPGAVRTAPVAFGASTGRILRELGYSDGDIDALAKQGAI
jgi:crotonobetainyl-CoA:carnitine CoA-transferase CaiB-like acyl-CoA transferase